MNAGNRKAETSMLQSSMNAFTAGTSESMKSDILILATVLFAMQVALFGWRKAPMAFLGSCGAILFIWVSPIIFAAL
jgi:hypothetical protein